MQFEFTVQMLSPFLFYLLSTVTCMVLQVKNIKIATTQINIRMVTANQMSVHLPNPVQLI